MPNDDDIRYPHTYAEDGNGPCGYEPNLDEYRDIVGQGGPKAPRAPYRQDDTLQTKATVQIVDALCEGPIVGLVNGLNSVYVNETPILNDADEPNFTGIKVELRVGTPDQAPLSDFGGPERITQVNALVKQGIPVVRTVTDTAVRRVRVTARFPALVESKQNGDVVSSSVTFTLERRKAGGSYENVHHVTVTDKSTSASELDYEIDLPEPGVWDIRFSRVSPDSDDTLVQNSVYWQYYSEIVPTIQNYADTAVVGITTDTELFGDSVPDRYYLLDTKADVEIPSNYNPTTRKYTGMWDGTFTTGYTNNPVWCWRDVVVNDRYGLGEYVTRQMMSMSKWSLYQIARYCDAVDEDGNFIGVPDGKGGMEPRFTINVAFDRDDEAFRFLSTMAGIFRAMMYWLQNEVWLSADMPREVSRIVTNADVVDGAFSYGSASDRALHSVALVAWNDPENFYRRKVETVEDREMMRAIGRRETPVQRIGCTSRGEAIRWGRWVLFTEKYEGDTVGYRATFDHADVVPGEILQVTDRNRIGLRMGGLLHTCATTSCVVDAPFTFVAGVTYYLKMVAPTGVLISRTLTNTPGTTSTFTWAEDLDEAEVPQPEAQWVLTSTEVAPALWRVLSVKEADKGIFEIAALRHYPQKFDYIDEEKPFTQLPETIRTNNPPPSPGNLQLRETPYSEDGQPRNRLSISWTAPVGAVVNGYQLEIVTPSGRTLPPVVIPTTFYDILDPEVGEYKVRVYALGLRAGLRSLPSLGVFTVKSWGGMPLAVVAGLELFGQANDNEFGGRDVRLQWRGLFPGTTYELGIEPSGAGDGQPNPLFRHYILEVYDGTDGEFLRREILTDDRYVYTYEFNTLDNVAHARGPSRFLRFEVAILDTIGRTGLATVLSVANTPPPAPSVVLQTGFNSVYIGYERPADIDFMGAEMHISDTEGFTPGPTTLVYDGPDNQKSFPLTPGVTYYVRVGLYDAFGRSDIVYSTEYTIVTSGYDTTPPAVPTGLTLDSEVALTVSGEQYVKLLATWTRVADEDTRSYDIEVKETGGNYVSFMTAQPQTGDPSYDWVARPNVEYTVRVRAVDAFGNASDFCAPVTETTARDQDAPGAPSALAVTSAFRNLFLTWVNPADADFAFTEIWVNTTNNRATATILASVSSDSFTHSGLNTGETRYYWLRSVDTSGNVGAWNATAGVAATTGTVSKGDTEPGPPAVPTGLAVTQQTTQSADGVQFVSLVITWTANAETDFSHYELQVARYNPTLGAWGPYRSQLSGETSVTYPAESGYQYRTRVRAFDFVSNASAFSAAVDYTATGDTVAPGVPTSLTTTAGTRTITLKWTNPTDTDWFETEIWVNTTNNSATASKATTVSSDTWIFGTPAVGTTYYFWLKAKDVSGNASAFSAVATGSASQVGYTDMAPGAPAVPSGLSVTQQLTQSDDGVQIALLVIDWGDNTEPDFSYYEVQVARYEPGISSWGAYQSQLCGDSRLTVPAVPGYQYRVRIRSVDYIGNPSAFTAVTTYTVTGDTTAPGVPTGLTATAGVRSITLKWANPTDTDWFDTEIWIGTTNVLASATRATVVTTDTWVFATPSPSTTYYFWLRSKDVSGNASGYTSPVSALPNQIGNADFTAGTINADVLVAGSITTSMLEVGSRINSVQNLIFTPNSPSANSVSWAGVGGASATFTYKHTDGSTRVQTIPTGSAAWTTGVLYLYITAGSNGTNATVQTSTSYATASATGNVVLGSYTGGQGLIATYGLTTVTDQVIATNAVRASHIQAGEIAAKLVATNELTANIVRIGPSGSSSLDTIFSSGTTTIDGGRITTNSVTTNQLEVRSQDFSTTIQFVPKSGGTSGLLAWNSGTILHGDGSTASIAGGNTSTTGYVTWDFGSGSLVAGRNAAAAFGSSNRKVLGYWDAGTNAWYPRGVATLINGDSIQAGSVNADRLVAYSITADRIQTESLTANLLELANRAITVNNLVFEANSPSANRVSWRGVGGATPSITYKDGTGAQRIIDITVNSAGTLYSTGVLYIYYQDTTTSPTTLQTTTSFATATAAGRVLLASYTGGQQLIATYGVTTITDQLVQTNAIRASHIQAGEIAAKLVATNELTANIVRIGPSGVGTLDTIFSSGTTTINGGQITTNTVTAEKLEVRAQPYTSNIVFTPTPGNVSGLLSWNSNAIYYNGGTPSGGISSGSTSTSGYVTWDIGGALTLTAGRTAATAFGVANRLVLGYWDATGNIWYPYAAGTVINGAMIQTGAVQTYHMTANTISGDVIATNTLDAGKIKASTVLANSITVDGTAIGTTTSRASDPGSRINTVSGMTKIDPGMITVSGGTTLADWRKGGDTTKIDGGAISTNTITANKITVGNRNVQFNGFNFRGNTATNRLLYDAGTVTWTNDSGTKTITNVSGDTSLGHGPWAGNTVWIGWQKGSSVISGTYNINDFAGDDWFVLGGYDGGKNVRITYGQTYIDGANIYTGSVTADRISVSTLSALSANLGTVTAGTINSGVAFLGTVSAGSLTAGNILSGDISIGSGYPSDSGRQPRLFLHSNGGSPGGLPRLIVDDARPTASGGAVRRIELGRLGFGDADYGLIIRDAAGYVILKADGLGVQVVGTTNIAVGAITATAQTSAATVSLGPTFTTVTTTPSVNHGGKKVKVEITGVVSGSVSTANPGCNIAIYLERDGSGIATWGNVLVVELPTGDDLYGSSSGFSLTYIDVPGGSSSNYTLKAGRSGGTGGSISDCRVTTTVLKTE